MILKHLLNACNDICSLWQEDIDQGAICSTDGKSETKRPVPTFDTVVCGLHT